jgi:hypothetical protein
VCGAALAAGLSASACYSAGSGSGPPNNNLYYPVGLAVSDRTALGPAGTPVERPGDYLYVANSDFDLQYNGGTLQSYDLNQIRQDSAALVLSNLTGAAPASDRAGPPPFVFGTVSCAGASFTNPAIWSNGQRTPLGEGCAPPVDSTQSRYFKQSSVIGAFATDLQLSKDNARLFMPVRGDATLTWANLTTGGAFDCGQAANGGRCGGQFLTGNVVDPLDSRAITMPGEPFGMAQTQDGTAIAVTQQATQETSLLLSGVGPTTGTGASADGPPSMQFVLEGVPTGGNGIVAVPHDPDAVVRCEDDDDDFPCVRQAFLETSHSAGEVDLLRYYDDEGSGLHDAQNPLLRRPFLEREVAFPITVNVPGTDQRGIVIDDTPRLKCKAQAMLAADAAQAGSKPDPTVIQACAELPARVFIGSRSPASIIFGKIGGPSQSNDGTYDPDQLVMTTSVPLDPDTGVARLYLAPIVDRYGHYALRLFVVCYDASTVFVFDPDQIERLGQNAQVEAVIATGPGPFAMAFDPFCTGLVGASGSPSKTVLDCPTYGPFAEVAVSEVEEQLGALNDFLVSADPRVGSDFGLRSYRFGYLATFTNSYLQVLDLDDSLVPLPSATSAGQPAPSQATFESVVFTLGNPTPPKGT